MPKTLITHIGTLAGIHPRETLRLAGQEMKHMGTIHDAWLLTDDNRIAAFGDMDQFDALDASPSLTIDAKGGTVLPCWCDPHTHLVYAGSREGEFEDKIRGLSYAEIARRGGGILNSADRLHEMSEDELVEVAKAVGKGLLADSCTIALTESDAWDTYIKPYKVLWDCM